LLFVLPVMVHGFSSITSKETVTGRGQLTTGLIRFLQRDVPVQSVVFADLGTSYAAVGYAPVYVVAVPPTHAANTKQNQIFKRKRAWYRFIVHPSLAERRIWH